MNRTILIEEDERKNRIILQRTLNLKGYNVIEASDDKEIFDLARKRIPDLIILNSQIPLRLKTAATLKSSRETAGIPVWAVSSNDLPREREKFLEAGCEDYLSKPVDTTCLLKFLKRIDEQFFSSEKENYLDLSLQTDPQEPVNCHNSGGADP